MPSHAETMLADVAGAPIGAVPAGTEVSNLTSRRVIDFNEYGFCRVQWADNTGGGTTALRVEYSLDAGATWAILVPEVQGVAGAYGNDLGDWQTVPDPIVAAPYNVLCRAMVVGNNTTTKVTYITLQMR